MYLFLQAFAIPGAVFLSMLAGPLFGLWQGFAIVSVVATCGACLCYLLSYTVARGFVQRMFPKQLENLRQKIANHRHNLFFYLLFLRLTPLVPNWFISLAAPLLDIPLPYFFGATFFGLMPANYLHLTTGLTLDSMRDGQIDVRAYLTFIAIGFVALIPTVCRKKLEAIDEKTAAKAVEKSD